MLLAGAQAAYGFLDGFLDDLLAEYGLGDDRLALVGFSQGTMMALHVAPRRRRALAGVLGFSGALLAPDRLAKEAVSRPPVLLVHGDADQVVPFASLAAAVAGLEAAGIKAPGEALRGLGHGIDERGLALGSRFLAEIFEPIIIAINGIPRTALAPLFIVWLGIGIWSKVGVVFLLVFFLNFFNTYAGMRQMDTEYVDLARLMGVRGWKLTFRVILPAISPYIFTGIRTSIPFSVIGAIVGEFIAATEGVGFFIRLSAGIFRTADVFVGIIVLMIMVIVMDKVADLIEKRALRWQSQTEHIRIQG
jgi:ABC-type proline/glycine betaine transport system permease subunit